MTTSRRPKRLTRPRGWARGSLAVIAMIATTSLLSLMVCALPATARSDAAITVARLVNEARDSHGRPRLEVRDHLNHVAYEQAVRMAARGVLFHNPHLADEVRGDWAWVGENVGYGPDVRTVHAAFMASPRHRANVLDRDFDELGTGVVRSDGRVWVVHVFRGW